MKRSDLEHIIRAASGVTGEDAIVVIGSQSILGAFPDAPEELLGSREADIFARNAPDKSDLIDGAIGESSLFDQHFHYYAQGVDETTAVLPPGWKGRLVKVQTPAIGTARGYCLDPVDLACSKLVALRPKDTAFVRAMLEHGLVSTAMIRSRMLLLEQSPGPHGQAICRGVEWLARFETRKTQHTNSAKPR